MFRDQIKYFQERIAELESIKKDVEKRPYSSDEIYGINLQISEYRERIKVLQDELNTVKELTAKEFLEELASKSSCSDEDNEIMQLLLRKMGFDKAVVTLGIVYLEGKGTIDAPPQSINTVAKAVLLKAEKE